MAGLSITRRRKAWLKGIVYGASGKGKCLLDLPKLKEIYQRGVVHGRTNADTPYVRAILEQEQRRHQPRVEAQRSFRQPRPRPRRPGFGFRTPGR